MESNREDDVAVQLAAARLALYRPGADQVARSRYDALLERAAASTESAASTSIGSSRRGTGARGVSLTSMTTIALVLVLLVVASFAAALAARTPVPRPVLPTGLPLAAALDRERSVLPERWRTARVTAASDDLDGATPLHATGRPLLVVRCPTADRSFQAVAGGRIAYGACGRPVFLPLTDGARVVVTTRGVLPFSAALLVPDVGS